MCPKKIYDVDLIVSKVIEVLQTFYPAPMKTREIAKHLCCPEFPVHKHELNVALAAYIRSGGTALVRDSDGYWRLTGKSKIYAGTVRFEDLIDG